MSERRAGRAAPGDARRRYLAWAAPPGALPSPPAWRLRHGTTPGDNYSSQLALRGATPRHPGRAPRCMLGVVGLTGLRLPQCAMGMVVCAMVLCRGSPGRGGSGSLGAVPVPRFGVSLPASAAPGSALRWSRPTCVGLPGPGEPLPARPPGPTAELRL